MPTSDTLLRPDGEPQPGQSPQSGPLRPSGPTLPNWPITRSDSAARLVHGAGLLTLVLGTLVLLGWLLDQPLLKSFLPWDGQVKANTAVGFIVAGWALLAGHRPSPRLRIAAQVSAVGVALLGVATLSQYALGHDLGIDELLFRDSVSLNNPYRGRMSPFSACAFGSIGVALACKPRPRLSLLVRGLAICTLLIGCGAFLGDLWRAAEPATDGFPPVGFVASIGFMLLAMGTLLASLTQSRERQPSTPALVPTEWKVITGFVGSLVLIAAAAGTAYQATNQFSTLTQELAIHQQVRTTLASVSVGIAEAVLAQRSYFFNADPAQLQEWGQSLERIAQQQARLRRLLAGNAAQAARLQQHGMLLQRFAAAQRNEIYSSPRRTGALQDPPPWKASAAAAASLRKLTQEMDNAEAAVLAGREGDFSHSRRSTLVFLLGTLLIAAAALTLIFLAIRREVGARLANERAMQSATLAAETADRAKSAFLATMSHEIRTPMNAVLGMLELMSLTRLDAAQQATLSTVNASSKSLMRIIDDILDFSKIEAGRLDVHPRPASVARLLKNVHGIYTEAASRKGVLLTLRLDPRISPALMIDAARVGQILNNLISNAIKFTAVGRIELAAELLERSDGAERVQFSVKDTGSGISLGNQQRLFQPFTQVSDEGSEPAAGTGLGLTICRRLAELMGGTMEMESELGVGTTMKLKLPLTIADPGQLPPPEVERATDFLTSTGTMRRTVPTISQAQEEGTLVLLVDDHPTNRALLCRQVNLLGYACEEAVDGAAALELWKTGRFGIVITDCQMPVMDGYGLARGLRELESQRGARRTPVVACTASALEGEAEKCLAAGMDDCLVKPVNLAQLLEKLDRWLPIPRETDVRPASAAAAPVTLPAPKPVDLSLITETWGEGAENLREVVGLFRRSHDEDCSALRQAVASGDKPGIIRSAHRMLGASRMLGATAFADACEQIEAASRSDDWGGLAAALRTFDQEAMRLETYLATFERPTTPQRTGGTT